MKEECCDTCKFSCKTIYSYNLKCRRFPPNPNFPAVEPESWCGEYKNV